jgi:hypothetical protein
MLHLMTLEELTSDAASDMHSTDVRSWPEEKAGEPVAQSTLSSGTVDGDSPLNAVQPSASQREFLHVLMRDTAAYAGEKGLTEFYFHGYEEHRYFCAYASGKTQRVAGRFIFGFERTRMGLFMIFPEAVDEPGKLSIPWARKPSLKRRQVFIKEVLSQDLTAYFVRIGKLSMDLVYSRPSIQK